MRLHKQTVMEPSSSANQTLMNAMPWAIKKHAHCIREGVSLTVRVLTNLLDKLTQHVI
jgi:hypothetical protein